MPEKINIPEPCPVKWNEMTPVDRNIRHCLSCQTPVVDFTKKTLEEIQDFFNHPSNAGTCGRYQERHTNHSSKFYDSMNKLESLFAKFKMKRLALVLIGGILLLSSCHRNVRGKRKLTGRYSRSEKTQTHKHI